MRGFQSNASEVRSALERLSDAGIVERVRLAPVGKEARRQEGNVVKLNHVRFESSSSRGLGLGGPAPI